MLNEVEPSIWLKIHNFVSRIGDLEVSPSPYKDCSAGNFAAVEGDCSSYKICNNGEYETQTCPPGLNWNRVSLNT